MTAHKKLTRIDLLFSHFYTIIRDGFFDVLSLLKVYCSNQLERHKTASVSKMVYSVSGFN